jgi:hypothetical protein
VSRINSAERYGSPLEHVPSVDKRYHKKKYVNIYENIHVVISLRFTIANVESFKYLGSILTNDGRCTCESKCKIAMAKAAFNKKRTLFTSTLDLEMRKKLVKCYI